MCSDSADDAAAGERASHGGSSRGSDAQAAGAADGIHSPRAARHSLRDQPAAERAAVVAVSAHQHAAQRHRHQDQVSNVTVGCCSCECDCCGF